MFPDADDVLTVFMSMVEVKGCGEEQCESLGRAGELCASFTFA